MVERVRALVIGGATGARCLHRVARRGTTDGLLLESQALTRRCSWHPPETARSSSLSEPGRPPTAAREPLFGHANRHGLA
jgi:hypothetical protein